MEDSPYRACHEMTGAILVLYPNSAHRLKRIRVIPAGAEIQFIQATWTPAYAG